jgi:hypothetical protein
MEIPSIVAVHFISRKYLRHFYHRTSLLTWRNAEKSRVDRSGQSNELKYAENIRFAMEHSRFNDDDDAVM